MEREKDIHTHTTKKAVKVRTCTASCLAMSPQYKVHCSSESGSEDSSLMWPCNTASKMVNERQEERGREKETQRQRRKHGKEMQRKHKTDREIAVMESAIRDRGRKTTNEVERRSRKTERARERERERERDTHTHKKQVKAARERERERARGRV